VAAGGEQHPVAAVVDLFNGRSVELQHPAPAHIQKQDVVVGIVAGGNLEGSSIKANLYLKHGLTVLVLLIRSSDICRIGNPQCGNVKDLAVV